jgi:hypothetical protein
MNCKHITVTVSGLLGSQIGYQTAYEVFVEMYWTFRVMPGVMPDDFERN